MVHLDRRALSYHLCVCMAPQNTGGEEELLSPLPEEAMQGHSGGVICLVCNAGHRTSLHLLMHAMCTGNEACVQRSGTIQGWVS